MPKFSEIFQKLESAEEYNKYPFMLAVKKEDEPCFNPIYIFGKSSFVDRAFITIAGGGSVAPEDPAAPLRRPNPHRPSDEYTYTEPFIRPTSRRDKTYEYWVLKGDTPVSLSLFKAAAESINCALEYVESEEDSEEVLPTDLNSIQFDASLSDPQEVVEFVKNAEAFLTFHLDDKTNFGDLKEVLRGLFNATVDWNDAKKEGKYSYHANYNFDTGVPENSNLKTLLNFYDLIMFDEDDWEMTFDLLDKISDFEFDKKFAYCDIAGRQQHIAALADILSQQSLCLFYSKWKELFTWYSNRMQAIPLNKPIPEAGITATMAALESICEKTTLNNISNGCFFLYDDRNNSNIQTIQSSAYFLWNRIPIKPKQKLIDQTDWRDVSAASVFKSVQGRDSQFQTVMRNLFWLFSQKHPFIDCDIAFNSTLIAKEIRVFAEFVLKLLCYLGHVPMASIKCKSQMCLNNGQLIHCTGKNGHPIYEIISEFSYYLPDDDRVNSSPCDIKNAILKNFYSGQCGGQLMIILPKINILMDDVSKLLHQEGTFNSTEVKDFLTDISDIVAFIKTLL